MKKILVLGDSFTYGQGCDDRAWYRNSKTYQWIPNEPTYPLPAPSKQCWASLLQQALPDYEVINLAMPGHSNSQIVLDAISYQNLENIELVIFAGTSDNRMRIIDDQINAGKLPPVSWVMSAPGHGKTKGYNDAQIAFMTHLYHPQVMADSSIIDIYAMHTFATVIKAKILWNLLCWEESFNDSRLAPLRQNQFSSIIEYIRDAKSDGVTINNDYLSPDGHANNLGHQTYFEEYLLTKIKFTLGIQ
jgi:hypothetical protein